MTSRILDWPTPIVQAAKQLLATLPKNRNIQLKEINGLIPDTQYFRTKRSEIGGYTMAKDLRLAALPQKVKIARKAASTKKKKSEPDALYKECAQSSILMAKLRVRILQGYIDKTPPKANPDRTFEDCLSEEELMNIFCDAYASITYNPS